MVLEALVAVHLAAAVQAEVGRRYTNTDMVC